MAPRFTYAELKQAIEKSCSWTETNRRLGYTGGNTSTVKKYAAEWRISTDHFDPRAARRAAVRPRFTEEQLRDAVSKSLSISEALRRLGYRSSGSNPRTFKKYVRLWGIGTGHFDPYAAAMKTLRKSRKPTPLTDILVESSPYSRHALKQRLFEEGIKQRTCEICGQGEIWRGRRMALILDHINGVPDDNRLENLRIICPNCAATLDTHCGRKNRVQPAKRSCAHCGKHFLVKYPRHRYCSPACGSRWDRSALSGKGGKGVPRPESRKVERPPYEQLMRELEVTSYLAVGRMYGVSDNAIRKWVRQYEREREGDASAGQRSAAQLRLVA